MLFGVAQAEANTFSCCIKPQRPFSWARGGECLSQRASCAKTNLARGFFFCSCRDDDDEFPPRKVLVVDEKTASASEILSAALKDNGRAKLAGHKTFGKAKVRFAAWCGMVRCPRVVDVHKYLSADVVVFPSMQTDFVRPCGWIELGRELESRRPRVVAPAGRCDDFFRIPPPTTPVIWPYSTNLLFGVSRCPALCSLFLCLVFRKARGPPDQIPFSVVYHAGGAV